MTKVYFDYTQLSSKVISKINDTIPVLDSGLRMGDFMNPPSEVSSEFYSTLSTLKNARNNLYNISRDIINANSNYEQVDFVSKQNMKSFNDEFNIGYDEPIIKVN